MTNAPRDVLGAPDQLVPAHVCGDKTEPARGLEEELIGRRVRGPASCSQTALRLFCGASRPTFLRRDAQDTGLLPARRRFSAGMEGPQSRSVGKSGSLFYRRARWVMWPGTSAAQGAGQGDMRCRRALALDARLRQHHVRDPGRKKGGLGCHTGRAAKTK